MSEQVLVELLKDPKVMGILITVGSNAIANAINSLYSRQLDKEVKFWIHPAYLVLSALAAGLGSLDAGTLHVDPETVKNFLTVLVTSVSLHMAARGAVGAHQELKSSKVAANIAACGNLQSK